MTTVIEIYVVQNKSDYLEEAFTEIEKAQVAASRCNGRVYRIPLTMEAARPKPPPVVWPEALHYN